MAGLRLRAGFRRCKVMLLSDEGHRSFCGISLSAEAGCRESVTFRRIGYCILSPLQEKNNWNKRVWKTFLQFGRLRRPTPRV